MVVVAAGAGLPINATRALLLQQRWEGTDDAFRAPLILVIGAFHLCKLVQPGWPEKKYAFRV